MDMRFFGSSNLNLRFGSISSLHVSRTNFSARSVINGVSRHTPLADIVGGACFIVYNIHR